MQKEAEEPSDCYCTMDTKNEEILVEMMSYKHLAEGAHPIVRQAAELVHQTASYTRSLIIRTARESIRFIPDQMSFTVIPSQSL